MYRLISFIVLFSFVSVMVYLHNQNGHSITSGHDDMHMQAAIEIPSNHPFPMITGDITQDFSGAWLLEIETENFHFTPKKIGSKAIRYDEGHAHLYINGEKINRIYGRYYNIDILPPGTYHIKVTLNGNNHQVFTHNGEEIAFSQTLNVP